MDRRRFLAALATGTVAVLSGCSSGRGPGPVSAKPATTPGGSATTPGGSPTPSRSPTTSRAPIETPTPAPRTPVPIPPPRPGTPTVLSGAPGPTQNIALTIDDGYCEDCVGGYVAFVEHTGIPITFSPNAIYQGVWNHYADRLRPLIEAGQVQIGNHTYHHNSLVSASDATIRTELESNDDWVQKTFGITSRPWLRPPFGYRNTHTDTVAAGLGYTKIVMWNGSFGDSGLLKPDVLLGEADKYLRAGTIMLGHANAPTVLGLFDQIRAIMAERRLQPVTLDTMFGTSRATG